MQVKANFRVPFRHFSATFSSEEENVDMFLCAKYLLNQISFIVKSYQDGMNREAASVQIITNLISRTDVCLYLKPKHFLIYCIS